jgi:hypothetical protein
VTTSASREKKPGEFWRLCFDRTDPGVEVHIRVPNDRDLGIFPVGMAADLHGPGPEGRCVCCHGRGAA